MDSILKYIRKAVGPSEAYDYFDPELIVFINSAFSRLHQLGVGPKDAFKIEDDKATWSNFLGDTNNLEDVKEYVYLKVRVVFDPPSSQAVLTHFNKKIEDLEWLLNEKVD